MLCRNIITEIYTNHNCGGRCRLFECLNFVVHKVTILLSRVRQHDMNTYTVAAHIRHSKWCQHHAPSLKGRTEHIYDNSSLKVAFYVSVVSSLSSAAIAQVVNCFSDSDCFECNLWTSILPKKGGGQNCKKTTNSSLLSFVQPIQRRLLLCRRRRHITYAVSATVEQKPHWQADGQIGGPVGIGFP